MRERRNRQSTLALGAAVLATLHFLACSRLNAAPSREEANHLEILGPIAAQPVEPDQWRLRFFVKITDNQGVPIRGLDKDQFTFRIDWSDLKKALDKVEVAPADAKHEPIHLVLVLDASTSMWPYYAAPGGAYQKVLALIKAFDQQPRLHKLGLLVISKNAPEPVGPTTEYERIRQAVPEQADVDVESTPLYDAILQAQQLLALNLPRKAILAITDGKHESGAIDLGEVITRLRKAKCPVFIARVDDGTRGQPNDASRGCEELARETGGAVFSRSDAAQRIRDAIMQATCPDYECGVVVGDILSPDGLRHHLSVRVMGAEGSGPFVIPPPQWWRVWWVWACLGGGILLVLTMSGVLFFVTRTRYPSSGFSFAGSEAVAQPQEELPGECPMCGEPMEPSSPVCPNPECGWTRAVT